MSTRAREARESVSNAASGSLASASGAGGAAGMRRGSTGGGFQSVQQQAAQQPVQPQQVQQLSAAEQAQDVALAREKLARARAHSGRRPEDLAAELDALPPSQRRVLLADMLRQNESLGGIAAACGTMSASLDIAETLSNIARATHELLGPVGGVTVHVEIPKSGSQEPSHEGEKCGEDAGTPPNGGGGHGVRARNPRHSVETLVEHALDMDARADALHPLQKLIATAFDGEVQVTHEVVEKAESALPGTPLALRTRSYVAIPCVAPSEFVATGGQAVLAVLLCNLGDDHFGKQATEVLDKLTLSSLGRHAGTTLAAALGKQQQDELTRTSRTLLAFSHELGKELDIDAIAKRVVEKVAEIVSMESAMLYIIDSKAGEAWGLRPKGEWDGKKKTRGRRARRASMGTLEQSQILQSASPSNTPRAASAINTHAKVTYSLEIPSILRDTVGDKEVKLCGPAAFTAAGFNSKIDSGEGWRDTRFPVLSAVYIPVVDSGGDISAVIHCVNRNLHATFSEKDVHHLTSFADMVGIFIEHSKLFQMTVRAMDNAVISQDYSNSLIVANRATSEKMDLHKLLGNSMERARETIAADRCSVFLLNRQSGELESKFSSGLDEGHIIRVPITKGFAGHVACTGELLSVMDAYKDKRFNRLVDLQTGYRTASVLCVPVLAKNPSSPLLTQTSNSLEAHPLIIGVAQFINKRAGVFTESDTIIVQTFTAAAASAIETSEIFGNLVSESNYAKKRNDDLLAVSRSLNSETDTNTLIQMIMQRAKQLLHADRCTLFLVDQAGKQLWSRFTDGSDLCVPLGVGLCGTVAVTGERINIRDAYNDNRFNSESDKKTGYHTKTVLCLPIRNSRQDIIGVVQMLNKLSRNGGEGEVFFTLTDERTLEALAAQAAISIENSIAITSITQQAAQKNSLLEVTKAVFSQADLSNLFTIVMKQARDLLKVDRCTLFVVDEHTSELWSMVADGTHEIRIPKTAGIAGSCYAAASLINIEDAYADQRFNPEVDRRTGYRTKSILVSPIKNKQGKVVGVLQMINKMSGVFNTDDEELLTALSQQVGIAIENANLLKETQASKNHLESILRSINALIVTLDRSGRVVTTNRALEPIFGVPEPVLMETPYESWLALPEAAEIDGVFGETVRSVYERHEPAYVQDCSFVAGQSFSFHALPMESSKEKRDGSEGALSPRSTPFEGVLLVLEDQSGSKRMMATLGRYMSPALARQVMEEGGTGTLGGKRQEVTMLFADIRSFTSKSEQLQATEVVEFLNEYFTHTVNPVLANEGVLDKFLGDGIMSTFGVPFARADDAKRACRAALQMVTGIEHYNDIRESRGQAPIYVGIGLNTGTVVCGNVGVDTRMEYTVIGDHVNVASRVEAITKQYGGSKRNTVFVSELTWEKVRTDFIAREVDTVKLVGKGSATTLYELLGEQPSPLSPSGLLRSRRSSDALAGAAEAESGGHVEKVPLLDSRQRARYADGLAAYRRAQWTSAIQAFTDVVESCDDPIASTMLERSIQFREDGLKSNAWDGVYTAAEK